MVHRLPGEMAKKAERKFLAGSVGVALIPTHLCSPDAFSLTCWRCARPNTDMVRRELTDKMIARLLALRGETGVGPLRLLKGRSDVPPGLDSAIIQSWLYGKTRSARAGHYEYVLSLWENQTPRLTLTDSDRDQLRAEQERTGVGAKGILAQMAPEIAKIKPVMISRWLSGELQSADATQWKALLAAYRAMPDQR